MKIFTPTASVKKLVLKVSAYYFQKNIICSNLPCINRRGPSMKWIVKICVDSQLSVQSSPFENHENIVAVTP